MSHSSIVSHMGNGAKADSHHRPSKLPLLVLGAIVAVAVLVTVALLAGRSPKTYPSGSPEALVQGFIQAAFDDDIPTLLSMLSADSRTLCEIDDDRFDDRIYSDGLRAELKELKVTGRTAKAEVSFHRDSSDGPFGTSTWRYDKNLDLILVEGDWLIDQAEWPSQINHCTRGKP